MTKAVLLLSICILLACEKKDESDNINSDKLIGCWMNPEINDTIWTFERVSKLKNDNYGLIFKSGQTFIERKNTGWCATPPITYSDFEGAWTRNDSIIDISVEYWGGEADYKWQIISVDENNLTICKIKEEFQNIE